MSPADLLLHARLQMPWIEEHLRALVLQETPAEDKASVDNAVALVSGWATALGFTSKLHKQREFGDILELSFGTSPSRLLILGHLDTVWPLNTIRSMPWKVEDSRFWGPGVYDMKAGVIMALAAANILKENNLEASFRLLLNTEEEVGSPVSRVITERLGLESKAVFVLEPAQGLAYKTSRKGVGHYVIEVNGLAAHSGVDFERGHSAIRELARHIESSLTSLTCRAA